MGEQDILAEMGTDAAKWAEEFCKRWPSALCQIEGSEGVSQGDDFEGTMIGWFANALMRGYDEGRAAPPAGAMADSPTAGWHWALAKSGNAEIASWEELPEPLQQQVRRVIAQVRREQHPPVPTREQVVSTVRRLTMLDGIPMFSGDKYLDIADGILALFAAPPVPPSGAPQP